LNQYEMFAHPSNAAAAIADMIRFRLMSQPSALLRDIYLEISPVLVELLEGRAFTCVDSEKEGIMVFRPDVAPEKLQQEAAALQAQANVLKAHSERKRKAKAKSKLSVAEN